MRENLLPVFAAKRLDTLEFATMGRHNDQATTSGVARDHQVVRSGHAAPWLLVRANPRRVARRLVAERHYRQPRSEMPHRAKRAGRVGGAFRAIQQFWQNDIGQTQCLRFGVEAGTQRRRAQTQDADAQIGIQQVARRRRVR